VVSQLHPHCWPGQAGCVTPWFVGSSYYRPGIRSVLLIDSPAFLVLGGNRWSVSGFLICVRPLCPLFEWSHFSVGNDRYTHTRYPAYLSTIRKTPLGQHDHITKGAWWPRDARVDRLCSTALRISVQQWVILAARMTKAGSLQRRGHRRPPGRCRDHRYHRAGHPARLPPHRRPSRARTADARRGVAT
jgi:hypothetical protein